MGEYKINNLKDTDKGIVCLENERDTVYTACMYLSTCCDSCRKTGDKCSLCREESEYKRVYIPRIIFRGDLLWKWVKLPVVYSA